MVVILLMQNAAAHLNLFLTEGLVMSLLCVGFYFISGVVFTLFS